MVESSEDQKEVNRILETEGFMVNQKKILIVENDQSVRKIIGKILERAGYTIDVAYDGGMAIELIGQSPKKWDLVITDNNMPKKSGIDVVKYVYGLIFKGILIPCLMMTSDPGDPAIVEELLEEGILDASKIIPKPVELSALLMLVKKSFQVK